MTAAAWCRARLTRGRYTWECFKPAGHSGPHRGGNGSNEPVYRSWFDVVAGGRDE